jgi:hypothetical protein
MNVECGGVKWAMTYMIEIEEGSCPSRQNRGGPQCQEKDKERTVQKSVGRKQGSNMINYYGTSPLSAGGELAPAPAS